MKLEAYILVFLLENAGHLFFCVKFEFQDYSSPRNGLNPFFARTRHKIIRNKHRKFPKMPQTPTSTPTPPPLVPPAVDETPSYLKKRVSGPRLSGDLSPIIPIGPMFRGDAYKISRRSASLTLGSKSSFFATNNKISQSLSAGSADEYSQGRGSNASSSPRLRPRSATIGDEAEALDDHSSSPLSLGRTPSPLALPGSADDVEDENIAIEVSGRVPIHAASQIFRRQR